MKTDNIKTNTNSKTTGIIVALTGIVIATVTLALITAAVAVVVLSMIPVQNAAAAEHCVGNPATDLACSVFWKKAVLANLVVSVGLKVRKVYYKVVTIVCFQAA